MEESGDSNSKDETGKHVTENTSESLESSTSPPPFNSSDDNNATSQATSGEGGDEPRNTPMVDVDANGHRDDTDGGKIYVPRKYDVLLGRGRPLQDHPGNLRFHKIINRSRSAYLNSRKEGKAGIAKEVLYEIKTSKKSPESNINQPPTGDGGGDGVDSPSSGGEPGRFLKKVGDASAHEKETYWIEVSQEVAIEKISHALRGRPRSETSNRSDGSGGSKVNSVGGKNQSGGNNTSGGNSKRKGPPSPPTDETAPNAGLTTGVCTSIEIGKEQLPQRSNIIDAILTTSANTPNRVPVMPTASSMTPNNTNTSSTNTIPSQGAYAPLDNQLQATLTAWALQQFQATMNFQNQNAHSVAQQQLLQQLMQQHQMAATGGGGSAPVAPFGQNQQGPPNTGIVGHMSLQQQQLQLLLQQQQQQVQQLLQQQAQQLQSQQLQPQQLQPQQLQYILQQNPIQMQQPQQQQAQSTIQQSQQTQALQQMGQYLQQQQLMEVLARQQQQVQGGADPSTSGSAATIDPNLATVAAAIFTVMNNQNIGEASPSVISSILASQLPQSAAPNQTTHSQPAGRQTGSGQTLSPSGLQFQQQSQQQSQEVLLASLLQQQPFLQRPMSNPNASSSSTRQEPPYQSPNNQSTPDNSS
jgi:hypothetical protein